MDLNDFKIKDEENIEIEENLNNENIISKSKNKLQSYFNKYCDFIGIENEGLKRLLIVGLISTTLFSIGILTIPFLIMVYLFSLFIQLINWIKEGFYK